MRFFQIYQYAAPLVLLPLGFWLWHNRFGDLRLAGLALSLPVVYAYFIPALGTNWLKLWEFNTRFRLGRFRPHHGFVFGAATSVLAIATLPKLESGFGVGEMLRSAFVLGSVLAFWNWLYDARAIRVGFIKVYTRSYHEGADPETIAARHAPILFGTFGACYGVSLRVLESRLGIGGEWQSAWWLGGLCHLACNALPVLAYLAASRLRSGEWGLRSYERKTNEV